MDSNNHDPKFENSKYYFNVTLSSELNENLNKSIKIGEVKATDEDDYDDGRLFYAILAFTHSYYHNLFSIHPDSGLTISSTCPQLLSVLYVPKFHCC